jgi:hypothetical protein
VYTAAGIFRRTKPPVCPECGTQMNYNGYNTYEKTFADSVEETVIPPAEDIQIVLYDEQHPKKGRTQKFRLTLLYGITGQPIAEELYDSKDPATIMAFLVKYLDPNKRTFVVTDLYPSYPGVFEEFFGENLIHQYCLAHLNKLIVADFPNNTTIEQELIDSFKKHVQKRLRKIEKNWAHFTAFYFVNGAPATNNGVEHC